MEGFARSLTSTITLPASQQARVAVIRDVVEPETGLGDLALRRPDRVRRIGVHADDEDLAFRIQPDVIASRSRVARDEVERLHVCRVADISDQHAKTGRRFVISAEVPNAP